MTNIVELNKDKAIEWYVKNEGIELDEYEKDEIILFSTLSEVFEYVYTDEADSVGDVHSVLMEAVNVDVHDVVTARANTVAEYLALQWERLVVTPYGYIAIQI